MISTDITGNNTGASQLLDLLSLVSNPQVYEAKVKTLQELTEKNQKYVEAVGPASEIIELRKKAAEDREAAAKELSDAKAECARVVSDAKKKAEDITKNATAEAKDKKATADTLLAQAEKRAEDLDARSKVFTKEREHIRLQKEALASSFEQAASAKSALDKSKAEVDTIRAELRKKLDAFAKATEI